MSIAGDAEQPAAPLPRRADISNRDRCCCKQTAGPRAGAWKGGRKRFAVSSAWLSASPWDGFLCAGFCCPEQGMLRARMLRFAGSAPENVPPCCKTNAMRVASTPPGINWWEKQETKRLHPENRAKQQLLMGKGNLQLPTLKKSGS